MSTRVSSGSGFALRSSFMTIVAPLEPSVPFRGSIALTKPTRLPPLRTSLPTIRAAESGTSARTTYVFTNGRPELAL
jgi:hypothetical protein